MTGQLLGHYRIVEKIGAGGMGEVFRARDERLDRDVAVKVIRATSSENPDHIRRFEQEARAAAALNHPNILAIYDVGLVGTAPYIVSELLHGRTLRMRLSQGQIPVREAADYALQIALGLTAAHKRHIVHRDLKPENLFLTDEGRIKILDFGVAKLQVAMEDRSIENLTTVTKSGAVVGTVAYMSPEQLRGKAVDHRADIFSLGAILYEMLSGRRAFRGETEVDTMTAILREEPPEAPLAEAAIPPPYRDLVRYCLEKEPENRFQSAKDLSFALQALSGSSPSGEVHFPLPKKIRKTSFIWPLAATLAVSTLALLLFVFLRTPEAKPVYRRLTFEQGTVYAARFAADGQSIVYGAAWNGKPVRIFSTVGNSLLTQPLSLDNANLLAVSHGNELAVVTGGSHNGQLETVNGMLASAPLAGGSPREIVADVRWADWDPNGKLAIVHYVDGHARIEFPIGNAIYQSGGWISHIRFSPQGDRIAFVDHSSLWDDRGTISLVDLNGRVQVLTPEWEYTDGLDWRQDGKEIWFSATAKGNQANLLAVTLSGKTRTVLDLPTGLSLQDIAPDGRVLVALHSKQLGMAAGLVGSKEDDVDLSWHDWSVAKDISYDGQFVLFEDSSEAAGPHYAVAVHRMDGRLPVRLGEGSAGGLSPDGKWAISFSIGDPQRVILLPIGAGQPRSLNQIGLDHINSGWARFMPSGQQIIVNGSAQGHSVRCYMLDLNGEKPKPITPEGVRCGPPSPDGHLIATVGPDQITTIYSIDGGPGKPIPGAQTGYRPVQWSPSGSILYGYREGELPSRIYRVDVVTGRRSLLQQLKPSAPAGIVNISPIVVSRDGNRFAYSYNQTLSVLFLISGLH
jgi:serine/threonine protein kinase/dipeptidyl aminopeptidase/acylaminoacyl peptidase